jgi:alkylation response protein AidB-like acyl-CoA dehydrogenase
MHFHFNDEQRMVRDMAREFAVKELAPRAKEIDSKHQFPKEEVAQLGKLGLMGVMVPESLGGAGFDVLSYILAIEEISRGCASTGVIMSVNNSLVCDPILHYGTEEQKAKFLPPLASGTGLGCFALTESGAGSDPANMKTIAIDKGDHWLLNGHKIFITNGQEATLCLVFAATDPKAGSKGISAFVFDTKTPGFQVAKLEEKMGINGSSTAELLFDNVKIPKENLIGQLNQGFKVAMTTLDGGRIGIAAQALGIAGAALEAARTYAQGRVQFGKPISEFQAIQWMIADMATELDAARLLTYRAACLKQEKLDNNGEGSFSLESAMAKLKAAEVANFCTNKALQIHGGYGYTKDFAVERHYRDAKITEIYEGTSEIQRLVISSYLLKKK